MARSTVPNGKVNFLLRKIIITFPFYFLKMKTKLKRFENKKRIENENFMPQVKEKKSLMGVLLKRT